MASARPFAAAFVALLIAGIDCELKAEENAEEAVPLYAMKETVNDKPYDRKAYPRRADVFLRKSPDPKGEIVKPLIFNEPVTLEGWVPPRVDPPKTGFLSKDDMDGMIIDDDLWYKITTADGVSGFVHDSSLISASQFNIVHHFAVGAREFPRMVKANAASTNPVKKHAGIYAVDKCRPVPELKRNEDRFMSGVDSAFDAIYFMGLIVIWTDNDTVYEGLVAGKSIRKRKLIGTPRRQGEIMIYPARHIKDGVVQERTEYIAFDRRNMLASSDGKSAKKIGFVHCGTIEEMLPQLQRFFHRWIEFKPANLHPESASVKRRQVQ